jgi:tetratricopeptide (TPR) repeat protein
MHEILIQQKKYDVAMAEFWKALELGGAGGLYPRSQEVAWKQAYAEGGIAGFWRARVKFLSAYFPDDYELAKYLAMLGEHTQALTWLESAMAKQRAGKTIVLYARSEPAFDGLRNDARFKRAVGME